MSLKEEVIQFLSDKISGAHYFGESVSSEPSQVSKDYLVFDDPEDYEIVEMIDYVRRFKSSLESINKGVHQMPKIRSCKIISAVQNNLFCDECEVVMEKTRTTWAGEYPLYEYTCPNCKKSCRSKTSFPHQAITFDLKDYTESEDSGLVTE